MFKSYSYDGSLKQIANYRANHPTNAHGDFDRVLQNTENVLKIDPDVRHSQGIDLGDPDSADLRIVALGHAESGNSSLMLRLFYNQYDDEPEDNDLLQWEQHQMNYQYSDNDLLRISYFDLKGFDDVLSQSEMDERIGDVINHSSNVILLYYSIDNQRSFEDDVENGYSVQNIEKYVEHYLQLIDHTKFITILVGLKSDLEDEREISIARGRNLAKEWGNIPFVEVSSKSNRNIKHLLNMICKIYTACHETIDGDLNEAAAFDESKELQKIIIGEHDEYDEYKQRTPQTRHFNTFDIIITNEDGIDEQYDHSKQKNVPSLYDDDYEDDEEEDEEESSDTESDSDRDRDRDSESESDNDNESDDDNECDEHKDVDEVLTLIEDTPDAVILVESVKTALTNNSEEKEEKEEKKEKKERKERPQNLGLSKKTMSVEEFLAVPLTEIFINDKTLRDDFDIAKKICKFYDGQFGDLDTVCMVAESGKQPAISYWVKGDYVRKHRNIAGKHVLVYRAIKHSECNKPKVSQQEFSKYVQKISIEHENSSANKICDLMDNKFGAGCHYARSTTKKPQYDIYSRFSDKYDCGFKLPSGAYIIAWRR